MDTKILEKMKDDLKIAVAQKDYEKIREISNILNISKEQEAYFERGLTGYPSVDKVWYKYYRPNAEKLANDIPENKTVWDVLESKMLEYYDIPAIEYFETIISKEDFIANIYTWARTFRAMGIGENEVIPVYGPFFPDICAMVFALNMIGACPYFLKLAIKPSALAEETKDSKVAIVYDAMWNNVGYEFSKPRFKKVLVATSSTFMPSPKKEIVSFISAINARKNKCRIPNDERFVTLDQAKKIASYYTGEVKVPFKPNRAAFITSSSGTTVGGVVKGTVATNESTISQLLMGDISDIQYYPGDRCLCHFPPTASTSLNMLFLVALFKGETVVLDPRVSETDFYNQLVNLKPNMTISTGSAWEAFFNRVLAEKKKGKKFDFSYAKGWTVGGEGTDTIKMQKWNSIMKEANATHMLFSGYGSSELFSATAAEKEGFRYDFSKQIMSVGIPYAGINMGVFDAEGNELSYNMRGELRVKSKSAMKEYYNKPELTKEVKKDGWICTGDLAEFDEKGFLYIWGRTTDCVKTADGENLYLFDIANIIKELDFIDDAIVLAKSVNKENDTLIAHIVFDKEYSTEEKKNKIIEMNSYLANRLPFGQHIMAFKEHKVMLPYSKTTLKKDKNGMLSENEGYIQVYYDKLYEVEFKKDNDGNMMILNIPYEEKIKTLKK